MCTYVRSRLARAVGLFVCVRSPDEMHPSELFSRNVNFHILSLSSCLYREALRMRAGKRVSETREIHFYYIDMVSAVLE